MVVVAIALAPLHRIHADSGVLRPIGGARTPDGVCRAGEGQAQLPVSSRRRVSQVHVRQAVEPFGYSRGKVAGVAR